MTNILPAGHRKFIFIALAVAVLLLPRYGAASQHTDTPDLIHIRLTDTAVKHEMPDAGFLHDKHTGALKDQDCSACHLREKGKFVFKFQRIQDGGYNMDKTLYHEKCVGCHQERSEKKLPAGPLTSQCRLCHIPADKRTGDARPIAPFSPFSMDKSLHYRHEISSVIRPAAVGEETNCSACHHGYDKTLDKTVYIKGEESTCRYCHKAALIEKTRSFQTVAHESCLNCHHQVLSTKQKAGPTDCAACHDAKRLAGIPKLEDIPRIKRNQPDSVLMSLWLKDAQTSGKPSKQFVNPVAFNHKLHEVRTEHCYTCHHGSMETCSTCHTRIGSDKSQLTRLDQAMHSAGSTRSCMGCHFEQMKSKDCSGCHAQMVQTGFAGANCKKCHSIDQQWLDPMPNGKEAWTQIAERDIRLRAENPSATDDRIKTDQIPEEVTIDILADQYEGAKFPHRKIVQALFERIQKNELAKHSHDGMSTVCSGCHHHSPDPAAPPKCAACHGVSTQSEPDGRPGLKGAYHGQCATCHHQMGIEKPVATDCTACHKKRTRSAQR
ncbi:MAG: cytochrome c3 family protein [Desulfosalsimonadaceae bacterium]|nr:cytochrome c3 family protein [Desulfosalsimonadaceae bacterium]